MQFVVWFLASFFGANAAFSGSSPQNSGQTRRLIVAFADGVSLEQQKSFVEKQGYGVVDELEPFGALVIAPLEGRVCPSSFQLLASRDVVAVEEDFYTKWIEEMPVQFLLNRLQKMKPVHRGEGEIQWGVRRVNAPSVWPVTKGEGVKVAIVDSGIDSAHPDLAGKVAGGYNAISKKDSWKDDHGHGTHVAGIVAAAYNGEGVVGVAPGVKLYSVKVLDKNGGGWLTSILKGLVWCGRNDMQVVNMSLGSRRGSFIMRSVVWYVDRSGVVIVAAAGNDGESVTYPGAYSRTIAVSASDSMDGIAFFSSRGPEVDIIAPGVNIRSTILDGGYANWSGTSMATPHVTGLAALAISLGYSGPAEVRAALVLATETLPGLKEEEQGAGMVNAENLLPK